MNLYREVKLDEMEKQIEKAKNKVSTFMETRSMAIKFTSEFDRGDFKEAFNIANKDLALGYGGVLRELVGYCKAKSMIEQGEKIYTKMLDTQQS